jgi:chitosanase
MQTTQDLFFDKAYFQPAMDSATSRSALVIYDSFIHSGSILGSLAQELPEAVPADGGNERKRIEQYVNARHNWLANHSNEILRNTVYRTKC